MAAMSSAPSMIRFTCDAKAQRCKPVVESAKGTDEIKGYDSIRDCRRDCVDDRKSILPAELQRLIGSKMGGFEIDEKDVDSKMFATLGNDIEEQKDLIRFYLAGQKELVHRLLQLGYGSSNIDTLLEWVLSDRDDDQDEGDMAIRNFALDHPDLLKLTDALIRLKLFAFEILDAVLDDRMTAIDFQHRLDFLIANVFPLVASDIELIDYIDNLVRSNARGIDFIIKAIANKIGWLAYQSPRGMREVDDAVANYYSQLISPDDGSDPKWDSRMVNAICPLLPEGRMSTLLNEKRLNFLMLTLGEGTDDRDYKQGIQQVRDLVRKGIGKYYQPDRRTRHWLPQAKQNEIIELEKLIVRPFVTVDEKHPYTQRQVNQLMTLIRNPTAQDVRDVQLVFNALKDRDNDVSANLVTTLTSHCLRNGDNPICPAIFPLHFEADVYSDDDDTIAYSLE